MRFSPVFGKVGFFMELSFGSGVYFIGIGGISMSSLALILQSKGVKVAGYDFKRSENTALLEQNGIPVYDVYAPENQDGFDTVVFTAAISADDPELVRAQTRGARILSRAELLGMLTGGYKHSVGVAGTHGKSTTTGMLCHIFDAARADATVLAGAVIPSLNSTHRAGKGDHYKKLWAILTCITWYRIYVGDADKTRSKILGGEW